MLNTFKRIAKFLHDSVIFRNTGGVTVELDKDLTDATSALELIAGKQSSSTGARLKLFKPPTSDNVLAKLLVGATDVFDVLYGGMVRAKNGHTSRVWTGSNFAGFNVDQQIALVCDAAIPSNCYLAYNCYYDGAWRYSGDGTAMLISFSQTAMTIQTASSGTATNTITFSSAVARIDNNELTLGENLYTVNFFARTSSGLSPSASSDGNDFQAFLNRVTNILCANGDDNTYIWNNSYFDGTNIRSLVTNAGVQLTMGWNGWSINTFPVVAAGAVVTPTSRDGQPIVGKQWTDLTASRALGTIYQNVTGYEIDISVCVLFGAAGDCTLEVDTVTPPLVDVMRNNGNTWRHTFTATIPNLAYYRITATDSTLSFWSERR